MNMTLLLLYTCINLILLMTEQLQNVVKTKKCSNYDFVVRFIFIKKQFLRWSIKY